MVRRRNNGFQWSRKNGGATATTDLGTYSIEITTRGVAVRFESASGRLAALG